MHYWSFGLAFLLCIACFRVREPALPDGNTDWVTPTEPSILLDNFSKAATQVELNNYKRCLKSNNFSFQADPTIKANNIGLFSNWQLDQEVQYFNNLMVKKANVSGNALTFNNKKFINYSPDSLEFTAEYELKMYNSDTLLEDNMFIGQLSFIMVRNRQNEWQISQWQDLKTKPTKCWTELKLFFYSR